MVERVKMTLRQRFSLFWRGPVDVLRALEGWKLGLRTYRDAVDSFVSSVVCAASISVDSQGIDQETFDQSPLKFVRFEVPAAMLLELVARVYGPDHPMARAIIHRAEVGPFAKELPT